MDKFRLLGTVVNALCIGRKDKGTSINKDGFL